MLMIPHYNAERIGNMKTTRVSLENVAMFKYMETERRGLEKFPN
jgi:hypothetical protein